MNTLREIKRASPEQSCLYIDQMGGTGAVSRICEVSSAAVSQWRRYGIPHARLQFLRERLKNQKLLEQAQALIVEVK